VHVRLAVLGMTGTTVRVVGDQFEPLPGAETAFAALRAAKVRVCLVTDEPREQLEQIVDVLGWRDAVDFALAAEPLDGLRPAPAPDLVLAAALRAQVDDVREIAVASASVDDVEAGARAGAAIVAGVAPTARNCAKFRDVPHTHLVRGVHEIPHLAMLANSVQSSGGGR
jgi:beta-phosphoglucomutase-like phosphatase (HAD superfamily)